MRLKSEQGFVVAKFQTCEPERPEALVNPIVIYWNCVVKQLGNLIFKNMEITYNINNEVVEIVLLILSLLGALSVWFIVSDVFNFLRRKNKICGTK